MSSTPAPTDAASAAPDPSGPGEGLSFEHSASLVLGRLQVSLAELIRAVSGRSKSAADIERAFGIDYKLAWQVHRIANAANPLAGGANTPAKVSMDKLLKAAAKRHAPDAVVGRVWEAYRAFEHLVETEAGDRDEFEAMLAACLPETREKHELEAKQAAFKAMSQIKGVAMEAQVGAFLLYPSSDPRRVDRVTFSAYIGLRRLRAGSHIGFSTVSATSPTSNVLTLDGAPPDGLHSILLPRYCSAPLPTFDVSQFGTHTRYSVSSDHVGMRAAAQLVMAEHRPGAMLRYRDPAKIWSGVMNVPDIPMKRQTTDIYLHRDVYAGVAPIMTVIDTVPRGLAGAMDDPAREADKLPQAESIRPIVGGPADAGLGHFPGYVEMLRHVCDKLRWNAADFRGFRLDVQYPIYGAQYMIGFRLPDAPDVGG